MKLFFAALLLAVQLQLCFGVSNPHYKRGVNLPLKKHPFPVLAQTAAKLQRVAPAESISSYPMDGNVYPVGIYWTEVSLGTPPQSFQVAVDSGSSDLIVPSSGCKGCHPENTGEYDPSSSSTTNTIACTNSTYKCALCDDNVCEFDNAYETCNLTAPTQPCVVRGPLYSDMFAIGDLQTNVPFGAITYQSANFEQFFVIDGVIGFAFDTGSSFHGTSPLQALVDQGDIADMFAMCLHADNGGVLTLGGPDMKYTTGPFEYTPLLSTFGEYILYVIKMTDIRIADQSIGVSSSVYSRNSFGGCVVDSGTNILLVPSAAYNGIESSLKRQLCPNFPYPGVCDSGDNLFSGQCYQYSQDAIDAFPDMAININGVLLNMTGADYIVNNGTAGWFCFGVKDTGSLGMTIIGDTTMQNYYVLFDRENKRLGWAPVDANACSMSAEAEPEPFVTAASSHGVRRVELSASNYVH